MKLIGLGLGIAALLLLAACSGGGDDPERVLVLGSGDITEAEFRLDVRAAFLGSTGGLCAGLEGLSAEEAANAIIAAQADEGVELIQEANPDDRVRAGAIVKEECDRIG